MDLIPKGFTVTNMLHDPGKESFLFVFILYDFLFLFFNLKFFSFWKEYQRRLGWLAMLPGRAGIDTNVTV